MIPRAELRDLIEKCAEVSTTWDTAPLGFQKGARVLLSVASYTDLGTDESRSEFDTVHQALKNTTYGTRLITLTARIDSFDPQIYGLDVAERIRKRLWRESSDIALQAINAAYRGSDSCVNTSWKVDGRECQSSILSLKFAYGVSEAEEDNQGGWIEHCDPTGTATL